MVQNYSPVQSGERSMVLDALRGFALLGICMANSGYFSMFIFKSPEQRAEMPYHRADQWLEYFHQAFVDGKFYSIFSLLFGIGFAIIIFKTGDGNRLKLFYRRLLVLLFIGLAHALLIWDGDILFFYALAGMVLPLFRKMSPRSLFITALIMILMPLAFDLARVLTSDRWNISKPLLTFAIDHDNTIGITDQNVSGWVLSHTTYADLLDWNRSGFLWSWQMRLEGNRIFKVLGMFLIGLAVGKLRLYQRIDEHRSKLTKIMIILFVVGILGGIAKVWFGEDKIRLPKPLGMMDTLAYCLNVAPLAIAYAIAVSLLFRNSPNNFLNWIRPVGQMALTNYVMQSVICISIYYGIGAGLATRVGPSGFVPVAILVFLIQVLYSRWWLLHFDFGPLEWIWRQLTYGRHIPIKKA